MNVLAKVAAEGIVYFNWLEAKERFQFWKDMSESITRPILKYYMNIRMGQQGAEPGPMLTEEQIDTVIHNWGEIYGHIESVKESKEVRKVITHFFSEMINLRDHHQAFIRLMVNLEMAETVHDGLEDDFHDKIVSGDLSKEATVSAPDTIEDTFIGSERDVEVFVENGGWRQFQPMPYPESVVGKLDKVHASANKKISQSKLTTLTAMCRNKSNHDAEVANGGILDKGDIEMLIKPERRLMIERTRQLAANSNTGEHVAQKHLSTLTKDGECDSVQPKSGPSWQWNLDNMLLDSYNRLPASVRHMLGVEAVPAKPIKVEPKKFIPSFLETIQEVIGFLKSQVIKKKIHGMKSKFRFLNDGEVIEKGDYHYVIAGYGYTKYTSGDQLYQAISGETDPEYPVLNEVKAWLLEHPELISDAGKLLHLAQLFDEKNPTFYPAGSSIGEPTTEYVNRVFLRKL